MLDVVKQSAARPAIPFDTNRLDRLMDDAGIDVLIATSKHNVQYLLGGHRANFFESKDAMAVPDAEYRGAEQHHERSRGDDPATPLHTQRVTTPR